MNMQRANLETDEARRRRENASFEAALAAIWAALNRDGLAGWNDWNQYAALGENCI